MDPVTIGTALTLAVSILGPPAATLVFWLLFQLYRNGPALLEDHEEDTTEEHLDPAELARQQEEARLREEEARLRQEELERQREEARRRYSERLHQAVEELTANIKFAHRRVYVGDRKTGERFLGVESEESMFPADGMEPRPISNPSEMVNLLPSELAFDNDILDARVASGEALVSAHVERRTVTEPIYEPVYEERVRIVYVLLDVSPSMFYPQYDGQWRPPVWKLITQQLLMKALEVRAPFYMRQFDQAVRRKLRHALTPDDANQLYKLIDGIGSGDGTNMTRAITKAIEDFSGWEYDEADIMMVTDGEDDELQIEELRAALDQSGIRLHAIMLGVQNEGLRMLCDRYQIVDRDLNVYPATTREGV